MCNWQPAPPLVRSLVLPYKQVDVWRTTLDLPWVQVEGLARLLSDDEQERARKLRFERDRKHFIVARGILRRLLGCYVADRPKELQFTYGLQGKPALRRSRGQTSLRFNLTHSAGVALYAFARRWEVGVDIERLRPIPEADLIARHFLASTQGPVPNGLSEDERQRAFFRDWTRTEALLKAQTTGLSASVSQWPSARKMTSPPAENGRTDCDQWSVKDLPLGSDFAAALAVAARDWQLALWDWH